MSKLKEKKCIVYKAQFYEQALPEELKLGGAFWIIKDGLRNLYIVTEPPVLHHGIWTFRAYTCQGSKKAVVDQKFQMCDRDKETIGARLPMYRSMFKHAAMRAQ